VWISRIYWAEGKFERMAWGKAVAWKGSDCSKVNERPLKLELMGGRKNVIKEDEQVERDGCRVRLRRKEDWKSWSVL
jgi:hypothetical protein